MKDETFLKKEEVSGGQSRRILLIGFALIVLLICLVALGGAAWLSNQVLPGGSTEAYGRGDGRPMSEQGVLITHVVADGTSAAVLRRGDIILRFDEVFVEQPNDLRALMQRYMPGDTVSLTILRGDVTQVVDVTLIGEPPQLGVEVLGAKDLNVPDLTQPVAQVTAVAPNTPAADADIRIGDVVTAVDGQAILNSQELIALMAQKKHNETVTLTLRRQTETLTKDLELISHPNDPDRGYMGIEVPPPVN